MADSTQEAAADKKPIGWLPLESNPEVLNPFLWKLGVPGEWGFCDVFGLDPELLAMDLDLVWRYAYYSPARRSRKKDVQL